MPYDPNLPQENTLADAAQMRAQLNGLADLIHTDAAGPVASVEPLDSSATASDMVDKINELIARMKRQ